MKQKFFLFLLMFCCSLYFAACTSESYNIDNADSSDTTQVKTVKNIDPAELDKILKTKHAYTVKSAPTFVLSFSGQFNLGVSEMDLIENPSQLIGGQNFGVRNGWGINAFGKIPLDKQKGNLRVIIQGSYNHFQANFNDPLANGDVKYNVISLGPGIENNFTPKFSVKPFVGAAILASMISGSSSFTDTSNIKHDVTIKNSFRLGYTLYAGIEYGVSNNVGIQIGAKFTSNNTWLKSSKDDGNETEFALRDAFTSPQIPYGGWKNFAYTSFYIGTSIYFGVKDRIFKF